MSQDADAPISKRTVVYTLPGADTVSVKRDELDHRADNGPLHLDLYRPPDAAPDARLPAVLVVAGYPDDGYTRFVGCSFTETGWSVSWGRLLAASGMVAVIYTNREPAADAEAVLSHLRSASVSLGIDGDRLALLATSGCVPTSLWLLAQEAGKTLRCSVMISGYMLDLDASTAVADASRSFGFANPGAGMTVDDLPPDVPLFIARAGRDETPQLNDSIDRFVYRALARNLPTTVVNHATAPHAFDLLDDSETSRDIIRQMLAFMRRHLSP